MTSMLGVKAPHHSTPSCTMRHWKARAWFCVTVGARTSKLKAYEEPGGTSMSSPTRPRPQTPLSCGFCEPRRYSLLAPHVVVPVFCISTVTRAVPPLLIGFETDWLTNAALLYAAGAQAELGQ